MNNQAELWYQHIKILEINWTGNGMVGKRKGEKGTRNHLRTKMQTRKLDISIWDRICCLKCGASINAETKIGDFNCSLWSHLYFYACIECLPIQNIQLSLYNWNSYGHNFVDILKRFRATRMEEGGILAKFW